MRASKSSPESKRTIEQIDAIATRKGSPDINEVSPSERKQLLDWYKQNNPEEFLDYLEEFIMHEMINDHFTSTIAESLSPEDQEHLGKFIISLQNGKDYIQTFYICWPSIGHKDEPVKKPTGKTTRMMTAAQKDREFFLQGTTKTQRQFIINALDNEPEKFIFIAPFTKQAPENYTFSVEEHAEILQTILDAYERDQNEPFKWHVFTKFTNAKYIDSLFALQFLEQVKTLYPEVAENYMESLTEDADYPKTINFATAEERKILDTKQPEDQGKKYEIERKIQRQIARTYLPHLAKERAENPKQTIQIIKKLKSKLYPIFESPELIATLSLAEINDLCSNQEADEYQLPRITSITQLKALCERLYHSDTTKTEQKKFRQLLKIGIEDEQNLLAQIVRWSPEAWELFQTEEQEFLKTQITDKAPIIWLQNIAFSIETTGQSLEDIVDECLKNPEAQWGILRDAATILRFANKHETKETKNRIKEKLKTYLKQKPSYIINHKSKAQNLFSQEEFHKTISEALETTPELLKNLTNIEKNLLPHKDQIINILKTNPIIANKCFDTLLEHNALKLSPQETFEIFQTGTIEVHLIFKGNIGKIFKASPEWQNKIFESRKFTPNELNKLLNNTHQPSVYIGAHKILNKEAELRKKIQAEKERLRKETDPQDIAQQSKLVESIRKDLKKIEEQIIRTKQKNTPAQEQFHAFRARIHKALKTALQEQPEEVFRTSIMENINDVEYHQETIAQEIEKASDINPNIFYKNADKLRTILPSYQYKRLTKKYKNRIKAAELTNPIFNFADLRQTHVLTYVRNTLESSKDYGQAIFEEIKHKKPPYLFEDLLLPQLQKEIEKTQNKFGQQNDPDTAQGVQKINKLAHYLCVLETNTIARANRETILNLKENEQQSVFEWLELSSLLGSHNIYFEIKNTPQELIEFAKKGIAEHFKEIFETNQPITIAKNLTPKTLTAFVTYIQNVCYAKKEMWQTIKTVGPQILNQDYKTWKAWNTNHQPENNRQKEQLLIDLKNLNLLPKNISIEQYETWNETLTTDMEVAISQDIDILNKEISTILTQAIQDKHIDPKHLQSTPEETKAERDQIFAPLKQMMQRSKELKTELKRRKKLSAPQKASLQESTRILSQEFSALKTNIQNFRKENEKTIQKHTAKQILAKLGNLNGQELEQNQVIVGKQKISIPKALTILETAFCEENPQFKSNIEQIQANIESARQDIFDGDTISKRKLHITDEIDFETALFIGEKPTSSCQKYSDDPEYNQGLLSLITDPSTKIIQVRDDQNKFIARAIIRIVKDDQENPSLLLERIYTANPHNTIRNAIVTFAKQKARTMKTNLYTAENKNVPIVESQFKQSRTTLHAVDSHTPRIYSDAGEALAPPRDHHFKNPLKASLPLAA